MQKSIKSLLLFLIVFGFLSCSSSGNDSDTSVNNIPAKEIIKEINSGKDIYVENAVIEGDIDFRTLENPSKENMNIKCCYLEQSLCFINCTFTGKIIMSGAGNEQDFIKTCFVRGLSLKNCIFKSEIIASNCEFRGVTDFSNSIFESKVDFVGAYFANKEVFFTDASFNGETHFSNSKFNGNVNFYKASFSSNSYFQNLIVDGNVLFANCIFASYTDFSSASFRGITNFNYANFRETVIMNYVSFFSRVDFIQTVFAKKNEIKNCEFHSVCRFSETEFSGQTCFENNIFVISSPEIKNLKQAEGSEFNFNNNKLSTTTEMSIFEFNKIDK
ncbi:MAG TPA: pentapeptide repeat-containing protein [Bacteroidales bacterium]|nr:pentapeptide repeat-containing protein [Bacteroidales bacterium]